MGMQQDMLVEFGFRSHDLDPMQDAYYCKVSSNATKTPPKTLVNR